MKTLLLVFGFCSLSSMCFAQGFLEVPRHVFKLDRIEEAGRQAMEKQQPVIFLAGKDWSM